MDNNCPLVSVCMITYNHEKFIAKALESVLAQQCAFTFEIVIGEDCSKDNTREIVLAYAAKYPGIIVPLLPEKNLGAKANSIICLQRCRGKYIAFLEGDDYWTDPLKLRKQVDFMEASPAFTACFTSVDVIDEQGNPVPSPFLELTKDEFSIEDIIMTEKVFIPTATLFFRNILPKPAPMFFANAISGDVSMHLLLADKGKIKCLPGKTAIYREHAGGITKSEKSNIERYSALFKLYIEANEYFEYRYDKVIKKRLFEMSKVRLIFFSKNMAGLSKIKYVAANARGYFKYAGRVNIKEVLYYIAVLFFPSLLKLGGSKNDKGK